MFLPLGLWCQANNQSPQSFRISNPEIYNADFKDSLEVIGELESIPLTTDQYSLIKEELGSHTQGKFLYFQLDNRSGDDLNLYLRFCRLSKKIVLFHFKENGIHIDKIGQSSKALPSAHHYLPLQLSSSKAAAVLVYLEFDLSNTEPHYNELFIYEASALNKEYYQKTRVQNLYAGMIVLIGLFAFIAAYLIKYRALVYFGLHMLFWIPYFQIRSNLNPFWLSWFKDINPFKPSLIVLFLLSVFGGLFVEEYLQLGRRTKKGFWFFGLSHLITLSLLLLSIFGPMLYWINYALAYVLLVHLFTVIYFSTKKVEAAQRLLISFSILLLGALLMTLTELGLVPHSSFSPYFFQVGTLLFSLILFFSLAAEVTKIQQERQEVQQLIAIKSRFFEDISHELRSPLTLVADPLKRVWQNLPEGDQKEALGIAKNATEGLQNLVNQILDLSRQEFVPPQLKLKQQDLNAFLKHQLSQFSSLAQERGITLQFQGVDQALIFPFDGEKMQQIIANLLSNAIKFSSADSSVILKLQQLENKKVLIQVADQGSGISAKALPYIFDRFYQDPDAPPSAMAGTGIGLALCKALVEQHRGKIWVESQVLEGSLFSIELPYPENFEKSTVNEIPQATPNPDLEDTELKDQKARVLVVEDHPELRKYLKSCLEPDFEILVAENGLVGWEVAQAKMPDLIISDLMMPDLDGKGLTQRLKNHPHTSHIPIILLTAKSEQQAVNEGLAAGADDYLAKPFDSEELLLRVKNILKQRALWLQKQAQENLQQVQENTVNKVDKAFLQKLETCLEREFSNPSFGVENLADEVAMSKTHLNRKLKALLGISANKLIQNFRLDKAKGMLQQKEGNVSEIAFACGFNSAAYFVKCFKDKFEETPGQYI
ncbi:response regulator [Croceimicrobium sp.]|uniref:hybrid sensor histidine kinase/response regulator transcription factor n=1 Tax=Croceimicrobium sp. TaxID=2828340 RepID=UPI003BABA0F4